MCICNNRCAPRGDPLICCFFTKRLLTRASKTWDSPSPRVEEALWAEDAEGRGRHEGKGAPGICADGERTDTSHEVAGLEKDCQRLERLGLTLAEAKQLLTQLQPHVVAQQASLFVTTRSHCAACGTPREISSGRCTSVSLQTNSMNSERMTVCARTVLGVACGRGHGQSLGRSALTACARAP